MIVNSIPLLLAGYPPQLDERSWLNTHYQMPKIGDYEVSKEAMLKMMAYVAVEKEGQEIYLKTSTLIDNHVPDGKR